MRIIKGNKINELSTPELSELSSGFDSVVVDLGTGDGRFVYESAQKEPSILYVGIDPSHTQLEIYSKRSIRKKLKNVLFVQGSIENYPPELLGMASGIYVILPWGTLLQKVVAPTEDVTEIFKRALKDGGFLEIVLGYSEESEPAETERLQLPPIDEAWLKENMIPRLTSCGFDLEFYRQMDKESLKNLRTNWSKRLAFGQERPLYHLKFRKHK